MPEIIVIPQSKELDETMRLLRTAAYARVSSNSDDQYNSFLTQIDYYTDYIKMQKNMVFVDLYADEGITGTRADKRDEFNRMIEDCRQNKIDLILTKSVARFARNTFDCIDTVRELKSIGVNIIFEENGIDTRKITSESELIAMCSIAQEESISVSKNVTMGVRHRMKTGTFKQSVAPLGFDIENGVFTINEEEAEIVRAIFLAYREGKSIWKIANELTEMGIVNKRGYVRWTHISIKYILTNVRYKGDALLQKTYTTEFPFKQKRNKGELDMYYVKNANPAIVTAELFDTVNELLKRQNKYFGTYTAGKKYPLSRMLYCLECGSVYRRKEGSINTYWVCREHDENGEKCSNKQIDEQLVYQAFTRMYNRLVKNREIILDDMLERLKMVKVVRNKQNREVYDISAEIAELTRQILVINRLNSRGFTESASYLEKINELNGKIARLKKEKKSLLGKDERDTAIKETEKIISEIEKHKSIDSFNEHIFRNIVEKAEIYNDVITFILKNGLKLQMKME